METIPEEDYLQISGLQHYRFCPRQWALIHLEQQWAENLRTTEGVLLHERAHQEGLRESRGDLLPGGIPPGQRRAAGRTGGTVAGLSCGIQAGQPQGRLL